MGNIFLENDNKRPASHSIQLYILIDHQGLKFGFDYGDKVNNTDEIVRSFIDNKATHKDILNIINRNEMIVINHEAGSPKVDLNHNIKNNVIKNEDDFDAWNKDIHIIKTYSEAEIKEDIETEIIDIINSFLPLVSGVRVEDKVYDVGYWLYSAGSNASLWDVQFENGFMSIDYDFPDNLKEFKTKSELEESRDEYGYEDGNMNTIRALWDFSNEINIGDIVISKQGRSKYLGYGIVTSDYIFDESQESHPHKRNVKWIKKGEWKVEGKLPVKTLTNITQYSDYVERLKSKLGIETKKEEKEDGFSVDKILSDVFVGKDEFLNIVDILSTKKNIILQGSAGVGKTFIAKKIAQCLQEDYGEERIEMIQFHQSYSYEDFIQGYRPSKDSFELRNGIFFEVCEKAKEDDSSPYFLIIDEINRGNLSKIFGELMMLIEADKRGEKNKIKLAYSSDSDFYIPDNLYIIGTMNTADRSLTIVDYALRRRFAFIKMKPNFGDQFESFLRKKGLPIEIIETVRSKMNTLNGIVLEDDSLGEGFEIGHSYFCSFKSGDHKKWYNNVIKYEILPLIEEYWFDDQELVQQYKNLMLD